LIKSQMLYQLSYQIIAVKRLQKYILFLKRQIFIRFN
jgi:hypothetical protein